LLEPKWHGSCLGTYKNVPTAPSAQQRRRVWLQSLEIQNRTSILSQVALDAGFTQATADQEGDRAKRLVLERGEAW